MISSINTRGLGLGWVGYNVASNEFGGGFFFFDLFISYVGVLWGCLFIHSGYIFFWATSSSVYLLGISAFILQQILFFFLLFPGNGTVSIDIYHLYVLSRAF